MREKVSSSRRLDSLGVGFPAGILVPWDASVRSNSMAATSVAARGSLAAAHPATR